MLLDTDESVAEKHCVGTGETVGLQCVVNLGDYRNA